MNRNAPTTSGLADAGIAPVPHAFTSSELTSKFEPIAAAPSNDGLGAGPVVGGGDGVDGAVGVVGCSVAAPPEM
jgi:hypothetical protein